MSRICENRVRFYPLSIAKHVFTPKVQICGFIAIYPGFIIEVY